MYKGDNVPNDIMAGVIREEMLSRIIEKGFGVRVSNEDILQRTRRTE